MKIFTKRISFILLSFLLITFACDTEESLTITSPDPVFELQEPVISNIFLNFSLPNNAAFTISWNDEITGSSTYDIEMSTDDAFTSPITLGTSQTNSFSMSVMGLNDAIRNTGATTFVDIAVYMRVIGGSEVSNSILYLVTTYPTDAPETSSPVNGDAFVLSASSIDAVAMTINWSDPVVTSLLGITVETTVEAAIAGTSFANLGVLGTVTNAETLSLTHGELNEIALSLGIAPTIAGDLDLRIIARNTNTNGDTLTRTSETVTVSVTPYNVSFPYIYFVGDATTPGWNPNNNNTPLFRSQSTPNSYHYTGYFNAGAFKLLEIIGQWQPQWGTNDGTTLAVNPGGGSDPGTFNVSTAGYYTYTFSPFSAGSSFTVAPYDATSAPTYSTMGLIGQAIGGWGDADEINFTQDPNDPHLWYSLGVAFTNGEEFLIRANDMWADIWRYTGSTELFGTGLLAGSGANFPFTEPTGNYDVWFNDLDGSYVIIPN
ncbi:MAG: SusE domain-containing protein [Flavobacteriaceae bacterium]|nr:SusE domain-containing protein [Flavobacteriaceae bacterium]